MSKRIIPLTIFAASLALYIYTLAPSVPTQGDSGELITVAYTLGIAHPPGYPLYTLLAHLFTYLPWGSIAWRVNLFSAILHSATLAFVYLIILRLTKNKLAAVGTAAVLGLSQTFWLYSLVAEVFSLNNLFAVILIYLALQKRLLFLSFVLGLSLANHHTIILIFPALAYLIWPERKKFLCLKFFLLSSLFFILGLLPYLYILIRAHTAIVPVAWSYPETLSDLFRVIIRADYGTFAPALNVDPAMATISNKADQLAKFFRYFAEDFGLAGVALTISGVILGLRKDSRLIIFLVLGFFVSGVFFVSYANFPISDPSGFGLVAVERFYLLPFIFAALLIGLSFKYLTAFRFAVIGIAFYAVMLFINNFFIVNQNNNYWGLNLGKNILVNLAPKAMIVVQGDLPTFVAFYARYVENYRSDTEIITANVVGKQNSFRYLKKVHPQLDWTSNGTASIAGVIRANYSRIPIYWFGPMSETIDGLLASPSGMLYTFSAPESARGMEVWKTENDQTLASYTMPTPDQIKNRNTLADYSLVWYYSRMYSTLGNYCGRNFDYGCAIKYFQEGLKLDPYQIQKHFALAKAYEFNKNCAQAESEYQKIIELNSEATIVYTQLEGLAKNCFSDEAKAQYYDDLFKKVDKTKELKLEDL